MTVNNKVLDVNGFKVNEGDYMKNIQTGEFIKAKFFKFNSGYGTWYGWNINFDYDWEKVTKKIF